MRQRFSTPLPFGSGEDRDRRGSRVSKYSIGYRSSRLSFASTHRRRSMRSRLVTRSRVAARRPRLAMIALVVVLALFGYALVNLFGATTQIVTKNESGQAPFLHFLGRIRPSLLRGEGDGRINMLVLGMGGGSHPGGTLTDTIEVLSINPVDKTVGLLALPRDLLAPIVGLRGSSQRIVEDKINAAYALAEREEKGTGARVAKATVESLLDLPIHYFVAVDFAGFTKLVDNLGGVTVNVPKDLYDPLFPNEKLTGYDPFTIKAGIHHLDGKTALKYARSRETTSDFDRARRQQQVLVGLKERMLSLGVLANPVKLTQLLGIAADHLRTDITALEIERLLQVAGGYDTSTLVQVVIDNGPTGPLISRSDERGFYLLPKSGNFDELRTIAHDLFRDPYVARERAKIMLDNKSGKPAVLAAVTKELTRYGYQIAQSKTSQTTLAQTRITDFSAGSKPFTIAFLTRRLQAQSQTGKTDNGAIDLLIEIGENIVLESDSAIVSPKK